MFRRVISRSLSSDTARGEQTKGALKNFLQRVNVSQADEGLWLKLREVSSTDRPDHSFPPTKEKLSRGYRSTGIERQSRSRDKSDFKEISSRNLNNEDSDDLTIPPEVEGIIITIIIIIIIIIIIRRRRDKF